MFKVIPTTSLSHDSIDCLVNEGETFDGLAYLGIMPAYGNDVFIEHDGDTFVIPMVLIVNTDLLTQDRIDLIDQLEDDLDGKDGRTLQDNDYYTYMRSVNEFNLSGDDSFFDYGNSFVTIIAYEVMQCIS